MSGFSELRSVQDAFENKRSKFNVQCFKTGGRVRSSTFFGLRYGSAQWRVVRLNRRLLKAVAEWLDGMKKCLSVSQSGATMMR